MLSLRIVVGLGNPGEKCRNTPHNLGFEVVNRLAVEGEAEWLWWGSHAVTARTHFEQTEVVLAKPQTYMNLSGRAVQQLLVDFDAKPADLIIILDDLALPFGTIRIRGQGSSGGHKGLESIIQILGDIEFIRIRLGIQLDQETGEAAEYVLRPIARELREPAGAMVVRGTEAVKVVCLEGLQAAMNQFN